MNRKQQAAVLPVAAAILLLIVLLGSLLWGTSYRIVQKQRLESAMRESTRSSGQLWNYESLASGQPQLQTIITLEKHARNLFKVNLANVPGLVDTPSLVAKHAAWQLVAPGQTCADMIQSTAVLCGTAAVRVRSLPLGLPGTSTIHVESAVVLDTTH